MRLDGNRQIGGSETIFSTKRVFMRAEHEDTIRIAKTIKRFQEEAIPDSGTIIKRSLTYYGPKLRMENHSNCEQYLLTAPGPESQAILWFYDGEDWKKLAEVCLEFKGSPPQYDICLHCNEPISSVAHRRRSVIGACE